MLEKKVLFKCYGKLFNILFIRFHAMKLYILETTRRRFYRFVHSMLVVRKWKIT